MSIQPPQRSLLGFELETKTIPVASIRPLRTLKEAIRQSQKYLQIAASVRAVGLVECLVVTLGSKKDDTYLLLDGLMRLEVIKDLGWSEVECLIATDDEAYTYNKHISRISAVQEHRMIAHVVALGVPEERVAQAMNLHVGSVRRRARLLQGICPEVAEQLADRSCPQIVFDLLRRMKPMRQMEATELMIGQRDYSTPFIKAIWAATPDNQRAAPPKGRKMEQDVSREQITRLERELSSAQSRTKLVEETYGEDNLRLTIARSYLAKLLKNVRIAHWLAQHQPDYLEEFQVIANLATYESESSRQPA